MFVDATFFLAPDGFYQLLIFHGVLSNGKTFVAGFVLMESKSEKNYREIFSNLKSIFRKKNIDYELIKKEINLERLNNNPININSSQIEDLFK